ncbi:hypothetical protein EYR41_009085 [Orbilia oligospora]|uniref:Uncharacterized protein n=1 Tax=Orbilia oligospora TaxID=2813651 RepID=A0A7C8KCV4_ORBOL|nr:hypothetical protein TWF751_007376 [Orbilia oligospora]TGJ65085.1 hypothetical protein EYR41_009085 [Orbilia oligospora]
MNTLHRSVGRLMKRSADDVDVGTIISDVKNYDERLNRLIEDLTKYQTAISQLLVHQNAASKEMVVLYKAIPPERAAIDPARLQRVEEYNAVSGEMKEELKQIAQKVNNVIKQSNVVRGCLKPVKKSLDKRDNYKLDFERHTSTVDSVRKKGARTEREMGVQAKAEHNLEESTTKYQALDNHIRATVPPILDAIGVYIPYVLHAITEITTEFVGIQYRFVNDFATRHSLMKYDTLEEEWKQDFMPIKDHAEQFKLLQNGKAVHKPMELKHSSPGSPVLEKKGFLSRRQGSKTEEDIGNPIRRVRTSDPPPPSYSQLGQLDPPGGRPMSRQQSAGSGLGLGIEGKGSAPPRPVSRKSSSSIWGKEKPSDASIRPTVQKIQSSTSVKSFQPEGAAASATSTPPASVYGTNGMSLKSKQSSASLASAAAAIAAKKKAPPPPVPLKSKPTPKPKDVYVIALYSFQPQSQGDLELREGDRVKVIQKTENVEDWWEGEITGTDGRTRKGFFPANYCQME